MTTLRIRKIESPQQFETFVGNESPQGRISLYLWQSTWSKDDQRRWTRRLRASIEAALMSYHSKLGKPFPHAHELLEVRWKDELAQEAGGTFVAFITTEELAWFFTPHWIESQVVVARSFHIKPLLAATRGSWDELLPSSERTELVRSFPVLKTRGVATDHLPTAANWIAQGKATILMTSSQRHIWGDLEKATGRLQIDAAAQARGCDDVLDDLLECALRKGVSCWVVRDEELPSASPIAVFNLRRGA